jgi:hypothetical protein
MAAFASMSAAETRAKAKVADGTWLYAHSARTKSGAICVRVYRKTSHNNLTNVGWVELTDDTQT